MKKGDGNNLAQRCEWSERCVTGSERGPALEVILGQKEGGGVIICSTVPLGCVASGDTSTGH